MLENLRTENDQQASLSDQWEVARPRRRSPSRKPKLKMPLLAVFILKFSTGASISAGLRLGIAEVVFIFGCIPQLPRRFPLIVVEVD